MGCRPSKQATSKVRSVDHTEDPKCLCSPRKVRKTHKCDHSSNSSKRASGDSRGDGKKQSLSSGHRPRSAKSADLDFPAFSTTTAVYRKSASKTSKITLRLSCDGSTLEIEQCDYDLEKVRGDAESKPRPWSSAPNLTRLRDTKTRLFRDSYLPMKHSASAWSPSVTSTASGAHGGQIRVPVQINTPDDRLTSPGNAKGHYSSLASYNGSNSSREQGSKSFGSDVRVKLGTPPQRPRLRASSGFTVSDEREPLLHGSDDGSQRLSGAENNVNAACDVSTSHTIRKECMPHSNTLNTMLTDLENSLELTHVITHSSGPVSRRPRSLEVNYANGEQQLQYRQRNECGPKRDLLQSSSGERYNSDCSPDFEQIPVNVVSFVPPPPSAMASVSGGNHNLAVTAANIYFSANQPRGTCVARNGSSSGHKPISIDGAGQISQPINSNHSGLDKDEFRCSEDRIFDFLNSRDNCSSTENEMTMAQRKQDEVVLPFPRQSPCSSSTDSESVLNFVKLGCPVSNEMPSFMYASGDESPLSLFTPQHHILCPSGQGCPGDFQQCYSGAGAANGIDSDGDVINHDCELCMSVDATYYCDRDSPVDNLTQFVMDSSESEDTGRGFVSSNTRVCMRGDRDGTKHMWEKPRNDSRQLLNPSTLDGNAGLQEMKTGGGRDRSSTNIAGGHVGENHILSHNTARPAEEQRSITDGDIRSASCHPLSSHVTHGLGQAGSYQTWQREDSVRTLLSQPISDTAGKCLPGHKLRGEAIENANSMYYSQSRGRETKINADGNANPRWPEIYKSDISCRFYPDSIDKTGNGAMPEEDSMDDRSDFDDTENESDSVHYLVSMRIHGPEDCNSHQQESDSDSKNADYLMELLYPEPPNRTTKALKGNRFTYDFDFSQQHEYDISSHSDASDNEISPQCYVLIGEHKPTVTETSSVVEKSYVQECQTSEFTSMEKVKLNIIERNIASLMQRIQALDQYVARPRPEKNDFAMNKDVGVSPVTDQYCNSQTNTIYCVAGPVIHYPGSIDQTGVNSISLMPSTTHKSAQKLECPIKSSPTITTVKSAKDGNGSKKRYKRAMMRLCADILARNITAVASEMNITDVCAVLWPEHSKTRRQEGKTRDTRDDGCKKHSDPVSARSMAGVDTFPSDLIFSSGTFTLQNARRYEESCGTVTRRQIRVDTEGGRTSIDASTSGRQSLSQNSKGQPGECVIDSRDRIHLNLDGISDRALTSPCQMYGAPDVASRNMISKPFSNSGNDVRVGRSASNSANSENSSRSVVTSNQTKSAQVYSAGPPLQAASLWANCDETIAKGDCRQDRILPAMSSSHIKECKTQSSRANAHQAARVENDIKTSKILAISQHNITTNSFDTDSNSNCIGSCKISNGVRDRIDSSLKNAGTTCKSESSIDFHIRAQPVSISSSEQQIEKGRKPTEMSYDFSKSLEPEFVIPIHIPENRVIRSSSEKKKAFDNNSITTPNGSGLSDIKATAQGQKCAINATCLQECGKDSNYIYSNDSEQGQNAGETSREKNMAKLSESRHQNHLNAQRDHSSTNNKDITGVSAGHGSFGHHLPSQLIDQPPTARPSTASSGKNHWPTTTPVSLAYLPLDGSHTSSSLRPGPGDSAEVNTKLLLIDSRAADNGSLSSFQEGESEKLETTRRVPRRNVLSLVRYFEKVPYTRNDPK